jgi:glycosyltransferase involved in cell wall biosynthesis
VYVKKWVKQYSFVGITAVIFSALNGDLTTSLIVPCCAKHATHLFGLLKIDENQTVLPDEVVISLSESKQVESHILNALHNGTWTFPVTLILSEKKLYAGENRNKACEHATGDIFICQDADDIPHPQRVEIIKYFFESYHVEHLIHQYIKIDDDTIPSFEQYNHLNQIRPFFPKYFYEVWLLDTFANGNIAITKNIFEKFKWNDMPRGQDSAFNQEVYAAFRRTIAIKIPLLIYRTSLSSIKGVPHDENKSFQYPTSPTAKNPVLPRYKLTIIS